MYPAAVHASEALQILEDCPHLEDFSPTRIIGPVPGESFQEDSLSEPASKTLHFRLKKLSLRLTSIDDALEVILARCPRLEHLQFHRLMTPTSAAVARALLRKRVRCLSSIDVSLERNSSVTHTVLKALSRNPIQSMTVHTPLYSTYQAIGQLYGQRLKHIFLHLDSTSVEGLVHIFNQCQSLKTLEATMNHQIWYIDLRYVIGLPWVCHQLESLTIPFSLLRRCSNDSLLQVARAEKAELGPANKMPEWLRAENIFMKRLAGLSKLRRLHLNTTGGQIPVYGRNHRKCMAKVRSDMSWCLEGGLEQLVGLVNLESLCLGYQRYLQGEEELSWMKTNWPNLLKLVVYQLENSHRRWINHHWPELTVVELASEND
ncbi:hypothetical protein BGW41_001502 [Actinomortierella wolfii]|nr:hypothetical protein BGW41_001502 [Actinomortierella wolfii]